MLPSKYNHRCAHKFLNIEQIVLTAARVETRKEYRYLLPIPNDHVTEQTENADRSYFSYSRLVPGT
jgi:hypothetical protein